MFQNFLLYICTNVLLFVVPYFMIDQPLFTDNTQAVSYLIHILLHIPYVCMYLLYNAEKPSVN